LREGLKVRIRVLIVSLLVVMLCVMGYFLVDFKNKNINLKKKYNEMEEIVKKNELDAVIYNEKSEELGELKEKNKDKISKYEEVEKWNQEIKDYLD
jgi:hypothetical protein